MRSDERVYLDVLYARVVLVKRYCMFIVARRLSNMCHCCYLMFMLNNFGWGSCKGLDPYLNDSMYGVIA